MKYVIGLTGNIASGKSTASAMLREMGAHVVDADKVAHEVMEPGQPVYDAIVAHFGSSILTVEGQIDRRALGAIVFADAGKLSQLEHISHPVVLERIEQWLQEISEGILVVEAIKLLEARLWLRCDAIWVTSCTRAQTLPRVMARGLTELDSRRRIDSQPQLCHKLSAAHVLVDNSQGFGELQKQLRYAWERIPDINN